MITLETRHRTEMVELETVLQDAMQLAAKSPGLYGGRYVVRHYDKVAQKTIYSIWHDDDPDDVKLRSDKSKYDVMAHCQPKKCYGIGHCRNWINENGTIDHAFFDRKK